MSGTRPGFRRSASMIAASAVLVVSSCGVDFTGLFEGADASTDGSPQGDVELRDRSAPDAKVDAQEDASVDLAVLDTSAVDAVDTGTKNDVSLDSAGGDVTGDRVTTEVSSDARVVSDAFDVSIDDSRVDALLDADGGAFDGRAVSDAGDAGDAEDGFDASRDTVDAGPPGTCSGFCNTIDLLGQTITRTVESGPVPTMTGGAIVDGTYVTTKIVQYLDDPLPYTLSETSIIAGGIDAWVSSMNGGASTRATTTMTFNSNGQMVLTFCCGGTNAVTISYSSDGTTLSHIDPLNTNRVITYTRQ